MRAEGERNAMAVLTEADVIRMRALRADGWKFADLADEFGVAFSTAWNATRGHTWAHVPMGDL